MTNKMIQQLVQNRLADLGAIAPVSLHPVSIRLSPCDVAQVDVLAKYLGYGNRSQLLREIVESSIEDLVLEVGKSLESDETVSKKFRVELVKAIERAE